MSKRGVWFLFVVVAITVLGGCVVDSNDGEDFSDWAEGVVAKAQLDSAYGKANSAQKHYLDTQAELAHQLANVGAALTSNEQHDYIVAYNKQGAVKDAYADYQ